MGTVISVVVSGIISLVVSVAAFQIQKAIEKRGKLKIYYSFLSPNPSRFRIVKTPDGHFQLHVPITMEVYNPSFRRKIIRDVSVCLKLGGIDTVHLHKCDMIAYADPILGRPVNRIGGDNGSYSFSVEPGDIVSKWMMFVAEPTKGDDSEFFDEICLEFYNCGNHKKRFGIYKSKVPINLNKENVFGGFGQEWMTLKY